MAGNMADIAIIGGRKVWAGGPYSGQPVDSTPANAGDLSPYLTPSYTKQFVSQPQPQMPQWAQQQPTTDHQTGYWNPNQNLGAATAPAQTLPTPPWMNIAAGTMGGGGFNPGGKFGVGSANVIPSAQRWGRLAPTEQQGMQGYWNDQLGVSSQDVMSQMNKLRPQGFGAAPRWTGAF